MSRRVTFSIPASNKSVRIPGEIALPMSDRVPNMKTPSEFDLPIDDQQPVVRIAHMTRFREGQAYQSPPNQLAAQFRIHNRSRPRKGHFGCPGMLQHQKSDKVLSSRRLLEKTLERCSDSRWLCCKARKRLLCL